MASYSMFASAVQDRNISRIQRQIVQKTQGHYLGPMPVRQFFDDFMPWNAQTPKTYGAMPLNVDQARIDALVEMASLPKAQMYDKFASVEAFAGWPFTLEQYRKKRYIKCPFIVKDTHSSPDISFEDLRLAVDISITVSGKTSRISRATPRHMDFANLESFVELKAVENADAFFDGQVEWDSDGEDDGSPEEDDDEEDDDEEDGDEAPGPDVARDPEVKGISLDDELPAGYTPARLVPLTPSPTPAYPFENSTGIGEKTRGQYAVYAGVTMALQYRNHLFTILICGDKARLTRWDRSAAIVTRAFDYTEQPEYLFGYFARFAQLTDSQRGLDTTVDQPSLEEGRKARNAFRAHASELWLGEASEFVQKQFDVERLPLLRMSFGGKRYIIPAPIFHDGCYAPFGRSTRRGLIMRMDGKLFYFKDYSREDSLITLKESEIYARLHQHRIPHIAVLEAGGDVEDMQTLGHNYSSPKFYPWLHLGTPLRIRCLQAHRIILQTIGRDLRTFSSAKDLVQCMADAMKAHQLALEKAGVLHRDISIGNIMMTLDHARRRGFLIDWDHSVVLSMLNDHRWQKPRISRTGTWQFISGNLAANPGAEHTVQDDRESAFLVLAYTAVHFLKHGLSPEELKDVMDVFDSAWEGSGKDTGFRKRQAIESNVFSRIRFEQPLLTALLEELSSLFAVRYQPKPTPPLASSLAAAVPVSQDLNSGDLDSDSDDSDSDDTDEHLAVEVEVALAKWKRLQKRLSKPKWLYKKLAHYAKKLPADNTTEWIDNSFKEYLRPMSNKRKVFEEDEHETVKLPLLKKSRGYDGNINPAVTSDFEEA